MEKAVPTDVTGLFDKRLDAQRAAGGTRLGHERNLDRAGEFKLRLSPGFFYRVQTCVQVGRRGKWNRRCIGTADTGLVQTQRFNADTCVADDSLNCHAELGCNSGLGENHPASAENV